MLCTDVKKGKAMVFRVEMDGTKGLSGKTNISGKVISDLTPSDSSTVNPRHSKTSMPVNKTKQKTKTKQNAQKTPRQQQITLTKWNNTCCFPFIFIS